MRDSRERLGLAHDPRGRVLAERAHELERDPAIELRVVGAVDHAHPAGAEAIEHDVAPDQRAALEHG